MVKLLREILFLFFPPVCGGCGTLGTRFCKSCGRKLSPELHYIQEHRSYYAFSYQDPVIKHTIRQAKFHNNTTGFELLASLVSDVLLEEFLEENMLSGNTMVLVPIPLHRDKLQKRGFNQSELAAKTYAKAWQIPICLNLLEKKKNTKPQARIENKQERLKNIRGSFRAVRTKRIQNKHVVLVDDVLTTGATLSEARKLLLAAGAAKVSAVVLAH